VAEALASEFDVVMVDARGHGLSSAPEEGYDAATQAADLYTVIQSLELQKPFVLGHSMGAVTTLVLAGLYPEVPQAILLEDPVGWWSADQAHLLDSADRLVGIKTWAQQVNRQTRPELIAGVRAENPAWSEAELGPWADSKLRFKLKAIETILRPGLQSKIDWPSTLRRITCRVLAITADLARGALLTPNSVAELQTLVPQLRVAHIPEAGHSIRRDQFALYLTAVHAFLSEASTSPHSLPLAPT
jgi:pimeloyl-ACP methyl ester carboxylesterase